MNARVHIPHVALLVVVWNARVKHVLLNVWGRTPIFYRRTTPRKWLRSRR